MRFLVLALLAAIAWRASAAPVERDLESTLVGQAAALDAALARGDARRAAEVERAIRAAPSGSLRALERRAQAGEADARFALGLLASRGLLVPRNPARACANFRPAAEAGHTAAAYHAALCLLNEDPATAARFLRAAAEHQHPAAQEAIGRACLEGLGRRDLGCAVRNLAAAAKAGRPSAQSLFAWMHATGVGVDREPITALALYLLAAAKGDLAAQNNLGELYETGAEPGLERDPRRAALWYEDAARGGFAIAQFNLGRLFAAGSGVDYDPVAARFWLGKAEQGGVERAAELLRSLKAAPTVPPR